MIETDAIKEFTLLVHAFMRTDFALNFMCTTEVFYCFLEHLLESLVVVL